MLAYETMNNEKLQKLCYYAYSWYLTLFNRRLFSKRFQAWAEGPVCPELYNKYKIYEGKLIPMVNKKLAEIIAEEDLRDFLEAVYFAHKNLTHDELKILSCSEEPWLNARRSMKENELEFTYINDKDIISWHTKKIMQEMSKENICLTFEIK